MNNLIKHLPTLSDIDDAIEMVESFELQDIKKAIGEDAFFILFDILQSMDNHHYMIMMLGAMDRLLNTNRADLVEFMEDNTNLRVSSTKEEKNRVADELIEDILKNNLIYLYDELPTISEYLAVGDMLLVLNLRNLSQENPESHYASMLIKSMDEEAVEVSKALEGKDIKSLISALYELEDIMNEEEKPEYIRELFYKLESTQYSYDDLKELLDVLITISQK